MNKRDYKDLESKNICMAECLSPHIVDISKFFKIYVPTEEIVNIVKSKLEKQFVQIDVTMNQGVSS